MKVIKSLIKNLKERKKSIKVLINNKIYVKKLIKKVSITLGIFGSNNKPE